MLIADKNSGVVLRAPFLASVLKQVSVCAVQDSPLLLHSTLGWLGWHGDCLHSSAFRMSTRSGKVKMRLSGVQSCSNG